MKEEEKGFIEHIVTTDNSPPEEKWGMYRHMLKKSLPYEMDIEHRDYHGDFEATLNVSMNRNNLNQSILLAENTGNIAQRTSRHVEDGFNAYSLAYCLYGDGILQRGNQAVKVSAGSIVLIDLAQPFYFEMCQKNRLMYFRIPREKLIDELKGKGDTRLHELSDHTGPGNLLKNYLTMLPRAIHCSNRSTADSLLRPIGDLVNACFIDMLDSNIPAHYDPSISQLNMVYRQAQAYIKNHCMQQQLSIGMLSKAFNYSESYLQRAFREHDTSFSQEMRRLRIEHACSLLLASEDKPKLIDVALASGFQGLSQFSRAFKGELGISASDFYRQSLSPVSS